ncbi:EscU/YscU/HrcU family type III secretion system export apparatus switch protein [Geodermatophilus sp. SYSU D00815]
MAKDGPGGEKTEKPTPKRLKESRKEGQVARTPELGTWAGVAAASVLLPMLVENGFTEVRALFVHVRSVADSPRVEAVDALLGEALGVFLTTVLPLALSLLLVGVASSAAQGGIFFATKALKPSFKKMNPLQGIKRMFGAQGLWESAKALIKTGVLGAVVYALSDRVEGLVAASGAMPLSTVVATFADAAVLLMRAVAVTGLVIAAADYAIVRMRTMKQLRMSRYEIEQEHKQSEGDPHVKAHRRSVQMAISRNRMMSDVREADVLLVNPTHVAVALKYEPDKGAPRVVAKGADVIAAKLREIAADARVPLVQDVPLARALHASCDIGQEVPAQLFTAVARVLAFVMHLSARGVVGGFHRPGFEAPDVEGLPKAGRRRTAA